jgi:lyso-ornithine lipid O-acyltransferase
MRAYALFALLFFTLPLAGAGVWLFVRLHPTTARRIQRGIYALYASALGIEVVHTGHTPPQGALLICNHRSWSDIIAIGSLWPVAFVAKAEVRRWPLIGWMAALTGAVFVERQKRSRVQAQASALADALAAGRTVVLFAEGTTHDAPRCLPLKSALLALIPPQTAVYPVAIEYTRLQGLPLRFEQRALVSWVGDEDLTSSMQKITAVAPVRCRVHIDDAVPTGYNRKTLAQWCAQHINQSLESIQNESI